MAVSGLDRCPVKNKRDQQQSKATLKRVALVLKCVEQHAGHSRIC